MHKMKHYTFQLYLYRLYAILNRTRIVHVMDNIQSIIKLCTFAEQLDEHFQSFGKQIQNSPKI